MPRLALVLSLVASGANLDRWLGCESAVALPLSLQLLNLPFCLDEIVADGLDGPEGLAWSGDALIVVEGATGRVLRVPVANRGTAEPELLALVSPGSPPASEAADAPQPPSLVFNGVAVLGRTAFVTGETGRVLYRIDLDAPQARLQ